jgi:hypothetical protein
VEATETDARGGAAAGGQRAGGADLETLMRVVERVRSNVKKVI